MKDGKWGAGTPERVLAEQARRGRLEAYNQLVLRFQASAYNLALRLIGDADAAANATQDGFLKAYQSIGQFEGGAFQVWLLRIIANTCLDELRKRGNLEAHALAGEDEAGRYDAAPWPPKPHGWAGKSVRHLEVASDVWTAIDGLPLDQRTVLILSDVEGLSSDEIAAIVDLPIGAVRSRLARARADIRSRLQAPGDAPAHCPVAEHTASHRLSPGKGEAR